MQIHLGREGSKSQSYGLCLCEIYVHYQNGIYIPEHSNDKQEAHELIFICNQGNAFHS